MSRRDSPHRAKVRFLTASLRQARWWVRRYAILQRHRLTYGGSTVAVGWWCQACGNEWDLEAPEQHDAKCPCR